MHDWISRLKESRGFKDSEALKKLLQGIPYLYDAEGPCDHGSISGNGTMGPWNRGPHGAVDAKGPWAPRHHEPTHGTMGPKTPRAPWDHGPCGTMGPKGPQP